MLDRWEQLLATRANVQTIRARSGNLDDTYAQFERVVDGAAGLLQGSRTIRPGLHRSAPASKFRRDG
jgi:hypothetical protein